MENYLNHQCNEWSHLYTVPCVPPFRTEAAAPVPAVPAVKQRCQANARERDRTQNVNAAFSALRLLIPTEPRDRKLSKIEILRLAGSYITHLDNQLYTDIEQPCLQNKDMDQTNTLCTFCWSTVKQDVGKLRHS